MRITSIIPPDVRSPDVREVKSGWFRTFACTLLLGIRPIGSTTSIKSGPSSAFTASFCIGFLFVVAAIVGLVAWDGTVTWSGNQGTRQHSLSESFSTAFGSDGVAGVGALALSVLVGCLVGSAALAWLFLIDVHRSGSLWRSYLSTWRVTLSGVWILLLLTAALGGIAVSFDHVAAWHPAKLQSSFGPPPLVLVLLPGVPLCIVILLWRLSRGVRAVGDDSPTTEFVPVCEGCGYDLTHQGQHGLCTECGMGIEKSLSPGQRPGCDWERSRLVATWILLLPEVIRRPRRFYRRLRLREGVGYSEQFARWNLLTVSVGAAGWMLLLLAIDKATSTELMIGTLTVSLVAPLLGCGLMRLVAALSVSIWIAHQAIPDVRWARKALGYESAFLWVFCALNGLLITSFVTWHTWITALQTRLLGHRYWILGVPPELLALLLGNAVLCLIWLLRYRVILRAIRWSNY